MFRNLIRSQEKKRAGKATQIPGTLCCGVSAFHSSHIELAISDKQQSILCYNHRGLPTFFLPAISGDLGPQKFIYALINFIHYAEAEAAAVAAGKPKIWACTGRTDQVVYFSKY